jgi:hypothetical protein
MVFKERLPRDKGVVTNDRLLELHLYPGNQCNRDCSFCTVFGSPKGWYRDYTTEHLDAVLRTVMLNEQGAIKFYGGEPTLNSENVIWAIAYLRQQGYQGAIVIYSNGIQAERLLQILASDPLGQTTASLNYSIATGDGAPPMPKQALERLETHEIEHPGAIAIGHPDVVDSGRGVDPFTGDESRPKANSRCPHCYPVLTRRHVSRLSLCDRESSSAFSAWHYRQRCRRNCSQFSSFLSLARYRTRTLCDRPQPARLYRLLEAFRSAAGACLWQKLMGMQRYPLQR